MGTFHHRLGELHGITVVVETSTGKVYVGRCETVRPEAVVLRGADCHEERPGGPTREAYLESAVRYGVHERLRNVVIPSGEVASLRRLGDPRG